MLRGDPAGRRNVTLTMFDPEGKPVARFYFEDAFPSKLTLGGRTAGASEALIETVTLVANLGASAGARARLDSALTDLVGRQLDVDFRTATAGLGSGPIRSHDDQLVG